MRVREGSLVLNQGYKLVVVRDYDRYDSSVAGADLRCWDRLEFEILDARVAGPVTLGVLAKDRASMV